MAAMSSRWAGGPARLVLLLPAAALSTTPTTARLLQEPLCLADLRAIGEGAAVGCAHRALGSVNRTGSTVALAGIEGRAQEAVQEMLALLLVFVPWILILLCVLLIMCTNLRQKDRSICGH